MQKVLQDTEAEKKMQQDELLFHLMDYIQKTLSTAIFFLLLESKGFRIDGPTSPWVVPFW